MQTILITGANRGIGLACVAYLLAVERRVVATARPNADCTELAALQAAFPERLTCLSLELTDPTSIAALPQMLIQRIDRLTMADTGCFRTCDGTDLPW